MSNDTYYGDAADTYDALHMPPDMASRIAVWSSLLRQTPEPTLELGSGTGLYMIPLAQAGHDIEGVDLSSEMIAIAEAKARAAGVSVRQHCCSMADLSMPQRFGSVIVPSSSITLLDAATAEATLKRSHENLIPGGQIILELHAWYNLAGFRHDGQWMLDDRVALPGGRDLLISTVEQSDYFSMTRTILMKYEYVSGGQLVAQYLQKFAVRLYAPTELELLLRHCGFRNVERFSSDALRPALSGDQSILMRAFK